MILSEQSESKDRMILSEQSESKDRMILSEQSESKDRIDWYVYIAKAKTDRFYVGISSNPEKRMIDHNRKKGSRFAKQQGPFILMYVSKAMAKKNARKREIQIKKWSRKKKQKLISGTWL